MKVILTFATILLAVYSFGQTQNSNKKVIESRSLPQETEHQTQNDTIPFETVTTKRNMKVVKQEGKHLKHAPQPLPPSKVIAPTSKKVD